MAISTHQRTSWLNYAMVFKIKPRSGLCDYDSKLTSGTSSFAGLEPLVRE